MKTIIRTAATVFALVLLSTGVFAADTTTKKATATNEVTAHVSYSALDNIVGIDIDIEKATEGKSTVIIYDAAGNVLLTDSFTNDSDSIQKSYMLDGIIDGDYLIKVISSEVAVQKEVSLSKDSANLQAFAF